MCKFKVGDKVEYKGKMGVVKHIERYEDYDGDDNNGPIILTWYFLDVDFGDKVETIRDWRCEKVEVEE